MYVAHDHHISRVAEDPPEPLDLASVSQVLGGKGVPEFVGVDAEPDSVPSALEEVGDTLDVDRPAVAEQQEVRTGTVGSHSVHIAEELTTQPVAHRHTTEFGALPSSDLEEHGLAVSVETLRGWMTAAGLWVPRAQRTRRSQPPRPRRACLGELVQIDGSEHAWFEDRGPVCTLLVYVDDATSRLMELAFAEVESTFDYFRATRRYLERHGKPMAFYSDRLSVFRVHARERAQNGRGLSQFGRALRELNIDLLCARSPEAKGRVERANGTLQDRLVKELRLRGLHDPVAAAPFLPEFMADYNRRFAKPPAVAYDAHRPLRPGDDLTQLFTLQETRRISRQLTVHYKRDFYVLDDTVATRRRRGATVVVSEAEDGTVTMRINGRVLAARLYPKGHAQLDPGVVEHKHLDGVFAFIAAQQQQRDAARLASPKLTRREKDRLHAGSALRAPALSPG